MTLEYPSSLALNQKKGRRMNVLEIKRAIDEGLKVCWSSLDYQVRKTPGTDSYFISCSSTGHTIGLTWADGKTLNGKEDDFFVIDVAETAA